MAGGGYRAPAWVRPVRELFLDGRGVALRATWHDGAATVVLSLWHAERCVGTVHLTEAEVQRLAGFLADLAATPPGCDEGSGRAARE